MRRLFVHEDVFETCIEKLKASFDNLVIGDPNNPSTQLGPLISENSFKEMQLSLTNAKDDGALVLVVKDLILKVLLIFTLNQQFVLLIKL